MGTDIWINTLDTESYKDAQKLIEVEFLPIEIKLIPIIFTMVGILLSIIFFKYYIKIISFKKKFKYNKIFNKFFNIFKFFFKSYYFNEIYNSYLYKYRNLGYILFKNLDKGVIEWLGPMLVINFIKKIINIIAKKNKGLIDHYVFVMIFGMFCIIIFIYFLEIWLFNLKIFSLIILLIFLEIYKKKK
jgi:NADH:ubiquinone oxidoreductase subunit 5 (subunit L)/multisubunit Na+/H+ antiporter MnhA subunit